MKTIDSNVHNEVPGIDTLLPYLPELWVEQIKNTVFRGPAESESAYPPRTDAAVRPGSRVQGGPPDLPTTQEQALGSEVEHAVLLCTYAVSSLHNPDQAAALARAVNDWQIAEWLAKDGRLRASIVVPSQIPAMAIAEIERVGDHPGFVQVALPVRSHHPYGNRLYHPLWEAIARHDLVAGIHYGGAPGNPTTPVGWPSYYAEEFVAMSGVFASQLTNIISEGIFDQFPATRVTFIESGTTWLPAHLWKFDKEWKNLRLQIPWVRRAPSAYVREHVRFTTAPWDIPADDHLIVQLVDQLGSDDLLMHGSGYPHLSASQHDRLIDLLPDQLAGKVRAENARNWYRGLKN